ncbi:MAG: ATP-binding protein [Deltaproteobacteria bacterium]
MEYDIIERMAEVAAAELDFDVKLSMTAKLISDAFAFDQCAVYIREGRAGGFILKAFEGEAKSRIEEYGEEEGLPGLVRRTGDCAEVRGKGPEDTVWEGRTDRGLSGFGYALALPVTDKENLLGVLYLKARQDPGISPSKKKALTTSALLIASIIKYREMKESSLKALCELKDVKARLINSEKLMSLGDMAATLAHEIKNPLMSIGGFALRLKKKLGGDSPHAKEVDLMIHEVGRIEKIMNGIVRSLEQTIDLRLDDFTDILDDAAGLFEEEIGALGIKVVRRYHEGPLPVVADREQMKIAFDNIIANALQSMEKGGEGGTLELETGAVDGTAIARITDSGGGINPDYIGHIFNPFFTTKKHGTGLGLPITNSIVMRHKGMIEIDNKAGVGVSFTIKLPHAGYKRTCKE